MEQALTDQEKWRNHYEVEKELAVRLRDSTREERTTLFATLYDELFERVPEHPRLTRRETAAESREAVRKQMALIRPHLDGVETFLEIAPGDCRLSFEVCQSVDKVYAVDISDQSGDEGGKPENFEHIIYDGFSCPVENNSIDLAFSYQFLEHLHPDDVEPHFELIKRVLRPGGRYIFDTPHRFSGPWDVSRYFSDYPEGFHMQEWTYFEMGQILKRLGFSQWYPYRKGKVRTSKAIAAANLLVERVLDLLPRKLERRYSGRLFQAVTMLVVK